MALVKCKECGKEYHNTLVKCPNCGTPSKLGNIQALAVTFVLIFAALAGIIFALKWCA